MTGSVDVLGVHVVVMGVAGTGKSVVAGLLAQRFGAALVEGDEHHAAANIAKMASGTPLTDEDRWPWLEALARVLGEHEREGRLVVMACSALRRPYRDVLRSGVPSGRLRFVHLTGEYDVLARRMRRRRDHFMPASLLESQLATLEPLEADEDGIVVDVAPPREAVMAEVLQALGVPAAGSPR